MTSTEMTKPTADVAKHAIARELLTAAISYAVAGWPVLPLHAPGTDGTCSCGRSDCTSPGKHLRTKHGLTDASSDPQRITAWWRRCPDANVGVRTGELVVLDVDGKPGERSLRELQTSHDALPATRHAITARGVHLYFYADGRDLGCSAGRIAPGIDVRGCGGYIIAPLSQHSSGHHYRWGPSGRRGRPRAPGHGTSRLASPSSPLGWPS